MLDLAWDTIIDASRVHAIDIKRSTHADKNIDRNRECASVSDSDSDSEKERHGETEEVKKGE